MGDLAQLTTAFSGLQLVVVVFLFMELRGLLKEQTRVANRLETQAREIADLSRKLSNVMGRLKVSMEDD